MGLLTKFLDVLWGEIHWQKKWSENNDPPMENVVAHSTLPFPGSSPAISQVGARTGDML